MPKKESEGENIYFGTHDQHQADPTPLDPRPSAPNEDTEGHKPCHHVQGIDRQYLGPVFKIDDI